MNGNHVKFNESGYKHALQKALGGAMDTVTKDIYNMMLLNLADLKVRKVDAEHATSFPQALKMTKKNTATRFVTHFGMNNSGKNQSFRAIYYEFGTGANMRPPKGWSPSDSINDWNPARPKRFGADIYFRDRPWYDLGGNYHKGGVRKGVRKRIPQKNIYGHPVRAHYWFRRALQLGTRRMDVAVLQAVKSVPVTAYIKLRDIRVRM